MGQGDSLPQERKDAIASEFFRTRPDFMKVGIDDSLLKYYGLDSAAKLEDFSSLLLTELGNNVPNYVEKVGSSLADLNSVPNAVGIGALVISMILQICFIKGQNRAEPSTADLLRGVFAEEKSSEVRDLMEEYLKRYRMDLGDDQLLLGDTKRLEEQLSVQLTRLKNSMLTDGQMSSRALRHWANGAAFHVQMLIHSARLKKKLGSGFRSAKISAISAINTYNGDLHVLLKSYRDYKVSSLKVVQTWLWWAAFAGPETDVRMYICSVTDEDSGYKLETDDLDFCRLSSEDYVNYKFQRDNNIKGLENYFSDLQKNVDVLIGQQGDFKIPTK